MTLNEAAEQGIRRVRMSVWADPSDYVRIDIISGRLGPWGSLFAQCQPLIGEPTPQKFLLIGAATGEQWEEYTGTLNEKDDAR